MTSGIIFSLFFSMMSFTMLSCRHFSNFLSDPIGKQSAMSKGGQEPTSCEGSPMAKPKPTVPAKARPVNLVSRSPWSARENPSQDLGYLVNPVNVGDGQGSHTGAKVECSEVRRQENAQNPGSRATRRNLRTLPVQSDLYGQRLQEQSFKT